MSINEWEQDVRGGIERLGPAPCYFVLSTLMMPDFERAARIGELWANLQTRNLADLLIDCEMDRVKRAVVIRMLREREQYGGWPGSP